MKKTILFVLTVFCFQLVNIKAQAHQKGTWNIDLGIGFGIYKTKTTYEFQILEKEYRYVEEDGAVSTMIPLSVEYGISNKFGLGLELGFNNYAVDDSTKDNNGNMVLNVTESVKSKDFALFVNYHLLNSDKNDLFIGLSLGVSSINWTFDNTNYEYSGRGNLFKFYIKDRIFFSENIGILFNLGYTSYVYNDMESSDNNAILDDLKWDLSGVNLGTGLALKF